MPLEAYFTVTRASDLGLCLVSHALPLGQPPISCLAVSGTTTYVASGSKIYIYERVRIVECLQLHEEPILGLCRIGDILLSFDAHLICVIDAKRRELLHEIRSLSAASIVSLLHPAAYVNKVLLALADGALELWNVVKRKLIYSFNSHRTHIATDSSVSAMEQSPALDIGNNTSYALLSPIYLCPSLHHHGPSPHPHVP